MSETITRRVTVEVEFHHLDMMRVVHNSQYLCWFERGRFAVLEDVFPMQWAIDNMVGTPVVMSHCEYLAAVHQELGDGRSSVSVECGGSE